MTSSLPGKGRAMIRSAMSGEEVSDTMKAIGLHQPAKEKARAKAKRERTRLHGTLTDGMAGASMSRLTAGREGQ